MSDTHELVSKAIADKFALVHWGVMIYRRRWTTKYVVQSIPMGIEVEHFHREFGDKDEAIGFFLSKISEDGEE